MHLKKKRKLFVLYSIPINLANKFNLCKRKYLVSYSIPLSCIVVLLLGLGLIMNPSLFYNDSSYAVETGEGENNDASISTHIDVAHPEISIAVSSKTGDGYGNDAAGQVTTAPGAGTAYRSHKITITGTDIRDYQLVISGPSELEPSSGAKTVISGADGKTGESMVGNTWGYAWGNNADEVTGMEYNTVTTTGSSLDCTDPNADFTVSCEKKLVFGANFANGADSGTYTANVTLSLTSTPYLVGQAWSNGIDTGIDDMQDIDKVDGGFCKVSIPSGSTITLRDNRGGVENFYKIIKMDDGSCWMAENLRLGKDTEQVQLTSTDTDLNGDLQKWALPASYESENPGEVWNDSGNNEAMVKTGKNLGDSYKEAYGNYYSWCAATAGSCMDGSAAVTSTNAPSSICPKGWKLPTNYGVNDSFTSIHNKYPGSSGGSGAGWVTDQTIPYNGSISTGYNGLRLGFDSNDALFPAAGFVFSGWPLEVSSSGGYWARDTYADNTKASGLYFDTGNGYQLSEYNRYFGLAVRCVAEASIGVWGTTDNTDIPTSIKTMQDVTKEGFTDKYCASTTAANALVPVGSTINLKDARDNNIYTVVKLKDGKCWMQENLRLNLTKNTKIQGSTKDGMAYDWTVPNQDSATTQSSTTTTWTRDTVAVMSRTSAYDAYGNYYTWCAATAETCLTDETWSSAVASASICPKGWHLPTGDTGGGEYPILLSGLMVADIFKPPYDYVHAGIIFPDGSLSGADGSYSGYWSSSTVSGAATVYSLGLTNSTIDPSLPLDLFYGLPIRCVGS